MTQSNNYPEDLTDYILFCISPLKDNAKLADIKTTILIFKPSAVKTDLKPFDIPLTKALELYDSESIFTHFFSYINEHINYNPVNKEFCLAL